MIGNFVQASDVTHGGMVDNGAAMMRGKQYNRQSVQEKSLSQTKTKNFRPLYEQQVSDSAVPEDQQRYITPGSAHMVSALSGLSQKQSQIYKELFQSFSGDGRTISAIEFFKLCKLCKIYPTVITFEDLKKIVLKNREFWLLHQKYHSMGSAQ